MSRGHMVGKEPGLAFELCPLYSGSPKCSMVTQSVGTGSVTPRLESAGLGE